MILSAGEALIDMLPRTATTGEACFAPYAGGAVFNTAIALGRLGAPSAFFSGVSSDMLGEILAETLAASKGGNAVPGPFGAADNCGLRQAGRGTGNLRLL